jgi:hypothetical protein
MTDIVSVPEGDFTPGALATLQFPAALINAAWGQANDKYDLHAEKMALVSNVEGTGWLDEAAAPTISDTAAAAATPALTSATAAAPALTAAVVVAPTSSTSTAVTPADPNVTVPTALTATDVLGTFNTQQLALWDQLVDGVADFRTTYFPDDTTSYNLAEDWLQAAAASTSGLPAAVAAQMLSDDKDRILAEANRATDATLARFAAMRFPMPPGAAVAAALGIQQAAQGEIAASARKITIAGVEQVKWAIEKLISLRQMAMTAALQYAQTLAGASPAATQITSAAYEAQTRLINTAAAYLSARASAADIAMKNNQFNISSALQIADIGTKNSQFNVDAAVRIADVETRTAQANVDAAIRIAEIGTKNNQFNAGLALQADEKNQAAELSVLDNRVRVMLSELQSLAQMATALYNNLHVSSGTSYGVSGNDGSL